jgi:hypothetical protein
MMAQSHRRDGVEASQVGSMEFVDPGAAREAAFVVERVNTRLRFGEIESTEAQID